MSVIALVPVQHRAKAKSRLAAALSEGARAALGEAMLADVLSALAQSPTIERIALVGPAPLPPLPPDSRFAALTTNAGSLNGDLAQAMATLAPEAASTLLIVHGDLPCLAPGDIAAAIAALPSSGMAAVESADGGTNLLAMRPAAQFVPCFGPASFQAHRAWAAAKAIPFIQIDRPTAAFDVDSERDLARLRGAGIGAGAATRAWLARRFST